MLGPSTRQVEVGQVSEFGVGWATVYFRPDYVRVRVCLKTLTYLWKHEFISPAPT